MLCLVFSARFGLGESISAVLHAYLGADQVDKAVCTITTPAVGDVPVHSTRFCKLEKREEKLRLDEICCAAPAPGVYHRLVVLLLPIDVGEPPIG